MLSASVPAVAQIDAVTPYADAQNMSRVLEGSKYGGGKNSGKVGKAGRPQLKRIRATVMVNGKSLQSGVLPMQKGGHIFVPMRNIFEALGAKVTYDSKTRLINAQNGSRGMRLALNGADTGAMKGDKGNFDSAENPFIREGVTMVPLRLVSETMGAKVHYAARADKPLITIESKK